MIGTNLPGFMFKTNYVSNYNSNIKSTKTVFIFINTDGTFIKKSINTGIFSENKYF